MKPPVATTAAATPPDAYQKALLAHPMFSLQEACALLRDLPRGMKDAGEGLPYIVLTTCEGLKVPAFQVEMPAKRLFPLVEEVNLLLREDEDPWGAAAWWLLPHPRLRQRLPATLLTEEEALLLPSLAREDSSSPRASR